MLPFTSRVIARWDHTDGMAKIRKGKKIVTQGKSVKPKVSARGKQIISDLIVYNLSGDMRESAEESRKEVVKAIKGVKTKARKSTIRRRKYRSSDRERYPAGQPGTESSGRLFNDSGYMADKTAVHQLPNRDWVVAAPVGRLEAPRSGRGAKMGKIIKRIRNKAQKEIDLRMAAQLAPAATPAELKAIVSIVRRTRRGFTGQGRRSGRTIRGSV